MIKIKNKIMSKNVWQVLDTICVEGKLYKKETLYFFYFLIYIYIYVYWVLVMD